MKLGVRGKLFGMSLLILGVVGLISGAYLEALLRSWFIQRVGNELIRHAAGARELLASHNPAPDVAEVDAIADRMGEAIGARITVVATSGLVLGDSEVLTARLPQLELHHTRPEVASALHSAGGTGVASRTSATISAPSLYAAVRWERGPGREPWVVRASMPLAEVDVAVGRLRTLLGFASALGLVVAIFMSGLASHVITRTLRELVVAARSLARGERHPGLPQSNQDELRGLVGSFKRLSQDLKGTVTDLASERDRLDTILQSMREAVLALDADERVTHANPAAGALLGIPKVDVGKPIVELIRVPRLLELVQEGLQQPTNGAFDLPGPETPRHLLVEAAPLRATGGCVLVMRDITERRRLETMRRDFVANVSHELRTPVSVIQANTETLQGGALHDPEQGPRFLDAVARNATRLGRLIDDLLDLSRIEAGQVTYKPVVLDLYALVEQVNSGLERWQRDKDLTIVNSVPDDVRAFADPSATEQVLVNLLENAAKYVHAGGQIETQAELVEGPAAPPWSAPADALVPVGSKPGAVHVVPAPQPPPHACHLRITVTDNGPGIPAAHHARLFERFYRVDPGRSSGGPGGTGLGLSIVKHLVTAMGGEVGVQDAQPRGTVMWFTLPAVQR